MGVFSTSICLFLPILAPKPAQAGRPMGPAELFWAGGWSDHPSTSLRAKYLKNLKLMLRTGTFILGHCVKIVVYQFHEFFELFSKIRFRKRFIKEIDFRFLHSVLNIIFR